MQDKQQHDAMARLGITTLNAMQQAAITAIRKEQAVLLQSPTGTGKTAAFLLPLMGMLQAGNGDVQCLILSPSRELALQIEQVWRTMGTGFKSACFYGGHEMETELNALIEPPALLIGTPGRVADHMRQRTFDRRTIKVLVLDEFDKLLSLGFEEELAFIFGQLSGLRKTVFSSATAGIDFPAFAAGMVPHVVDFSDSVAEPLLTLNKVYSADKDKAGVLAKLLGHIGAEPTIIFCNHREAAERTHKLLKEQGIAAVFLHGGLEQLEREQALVRFTNGSTYYLVATNLAARGLDMPEVRHIVHYHIASTEDEFIHRNGRTARMHATGTAWLLLHTEEPLPPYLTSEPDEVELPETVPPITPSPWETVYISGGKKDKLNKSDIAGFLSKVGGLQRDELGLISVKDHMSFAAVKKNKVATMLKAVALQKMKGKKYKIQVAS